MWNSSELEPIFPSSPMCNEDQLTSWFLKFSKIFDIIRAYFGLDTELMYPLHVTASAWKRANKHCTHVQKHTYHSPHTTNTCLLFEQHQSVVSISDEQIWPIYIFPFTLSDVTDILLQYRRIAFQWFWVLLFRIVISNGYSYLCGHCPRANHTWRVPSKIFRSRRDTPKGLGCEPSQAYPVSPCQSGVSAGGSELHFVDTLQIGSIKEKLPEAAPGC